MRFYLLFASLFLLSFPKAQNHYDWFKIKKYKVSTLDSRIKENSSLDFHKDKLYTLNDGGNAAELFELDPKSGKILNVHSLSFPNKDWEALSSDSLSFYIGDFGNNAGSRKDLTIYKVDGESFALQKKMGFYFPEQPKAKAKLHQHDFDVESLLFLDNKLHVFTKQWQSQKVSHYLVDPNTDITNSPAQLLETFDSGFMATDVAFDQGKLYMVGYTKKMEVFLSVFTRDSEGKFFSSLPKKYFLGLSSSIGQIESIAIHKERVYLSGEEFRYRFLHAAPALYSFPLEKLK